MRNPLISSSTYSRISSSAQRARALCRAPPPLPPSLPVPLPPAAAAPSPRAALGTGARGAPALAAWAFHAPCSSTSSSSSSRSSNCSSSRSNRGSGWMRKIGSSCYLMESLRLWDIRSTTGRSIAAGAATNEEHLARVYAYYGPSPLFFGAGSGFSSGVGTGAQPRSAGGPARLPAVGQLCAGACFEQRWARLANSLHVKFPLWFASKLYLVSGTLANSCPFCTPAPLQERYPHRGDLRSCPPPSAPRR